MLIDELVSNKSTAPTGRKNVGKLWLVLHEINCLYIFLLITVYTASQLLWDHSSFSPTVQHFLMLRGLFLCFRKKLGRGRQHEGGGRQDAEGVWEPERLNQRGAAVNWEQSVYHPLLTAWGNMIAFCLVTVIVHKIIINDFTVLPLKYDKYDFMTLFFVFVCFASFFYYFLLFFFMSNVSNKFRILTYSKSQPHPLISLLYLSEHRFECNSRDPFSVLLFGLSRADRK